jgi:hypothetical protein
VPFLKEGVIIVTKKNTPSQVSALHRRDRSIKYEYVDDEVADIREHYYASKRKEAEALQEAQKSAREDKLAVTGVGGTRKRRTTTSGLNASEARKALAKQIKRGIKK